MELPETDNPVTEVTQEPAPEASTEEEITAQDDQENPDTGVPVEPTDEEVEYAGNKYKVPKELAPIIAKAEGMQADYTRKTMEAAELRKAGEARLEEIQQEAEISQQLIGELSQLHAIESELRQYQTVNWQQWQATDSTSANAAMARFMQLQNSERQLRGHVEGRRQEIATKNQQEIAKVIGQAVEQLNKPDPDNGWDGNFNDAKRDTLSKFALDLGISERQVANTTDPASIKILNLAMIGQKYLQQSRKASAKPPQVQANPVPTLNTGRTNAKAIDPEKMSMAQFSKWRANGGGKTAPR